MTAGILASRTLQTSIKRGISPKTQSYQFAYGQLNYWSRPTKNKINPLTTGLHNQVCWHSKKFINSRSVTTVSSTYSICLTFLIHFFFSLLINTRCMSKPCRSCLRFKFRNNIHQMFYSSIFQTIDNIPSRHVTSYYPFYAFST